MRETSGIIYVASSLLLAGNNQVTFTFMVVGFVDCRLRITNATVQFKKR